MADQRAETESGSAAAVAFKLMSYIQHTAASPSGKDAVAMDRKAILDLYAECLTATRGGRI